MIPWGFLVPVMDRRWAPFEQRERNDSTMLRPLLIAIQFLTRLPIRLNTAPEMAELGRSLLFYPVVGLMIGMLLTGLEILLPESAGLYPAAILLAAWVLLTGAFHLDGLADSADAWAGGPGDPTRALAIMKDPRCGPVGVVAVVLVLLLKFAALDLAVRQHDALAILFAPLLGRSAPLLLFLTTPYVRPGGLGEMLTQALPRRATMRVLWAVAIAVLAVAGLKGLWMMLLAGLTFGLLRSLIMHRIEGATGDTAGALIELAECAALTGALLF